MTQNFTVVCYQNEYLPEDGREMNAILTVSAERPGGGRALQSSLGAVVIVIDVSGSMEGQKLTQAQAATNAAIETIREGWRFAIVAGNEHATQVFPARGLVPATSRTRRQAASAAARLKAEGGTAIGEWISLTGHLLVTADGVRHAVLLTDGADEHETAQALEAALTSARGVFQCDCRGVGTDWSVAQLRKVSDTLLGTVDIVANPNDLVSDFRDMMTSAMKRAHSDVRVRVRTPRHCELLFFRQVSPELRDLRAVQTGVDGTTVEYPIGVWAAESRDYHLAVRAPTHDVGDELLVARVAVVVDGVEAATCAVRAVWTDEEALPTRINRRVAHFTGQQAIADAIQEGLDARRDGDGLTATSKFGLAARLVAASGHADTAALLEKVVDVEDWHTGRVHLKPHVELVDEMTLETRSTRTTRVRA